MKDKKISNKIEVARKSRNEIFEFLKIRDYSSKESLENWIKIVEESFWNNLLETAQYQYKLLNKSNVEIDIERKEKLEIKKDDEKEFEKCLLISEIIKKEIEFIMGEDFICNLKLRYENNDKFNYIEIKNFLDNEIKNIADLKEEFEYVDNQIHKLKKMNWYGENIKEHQEFKFTEKNEMKLVLIFSIIFISFLCFLHPLKRMKKRLMFLFKFES